MSSLEKTLSGNGFMSQFSTLQFPDNLSSRIQQTSEEPDSSEPEDSPSIGHSSGSMSLTRTLDFDKIFSAAGELLFDRSGLKEIDDEKDPGSESKEEEEEEEEERGARIHFKFIRNLPLYQDYCSQNVRDDIQRLKQSCLSELLPPQCVQGLQSQLHKLHWSQSSSPQSSSPQSSSPQSSSPQSNRPSTPITVTPSTLWQDLEEVKASGVLSNLSPKDMRLHETSFELICSEASYLRSLDVAVKHFNASKTMKQTLTKMEHHILFSNIQRITAASEIFLTDLEHRLGESLLIDSQVGDIVLRHCPAFRRLYVPYVTNMMYQEALIRKLLQGNKAFQNALAKLEKDPVCQRQSLKSFLVIPFQRITRIKLILETIQKLTLPESDTNLEKAIQALHELVQECDNKVKKMKQIEELICLEMQLDFGKLKSIPLVVSGRFLVHQGPMKQLSLDSTVHSPLAFTNVYLHLLSDVLIISSKRDEQFKVLDYAEVPAHTRCEGLKAEALGLPQNSFLLHLSTRHTGKATVLVLVTETRSAKETWMKALSSKRDF